MTLQLLCGCHQELSNIMFQKFEVLETSKQELLEDWQTVWQCIRTWNFLLYPTSNLCAFTSEFETLLKEISHYDIYILGDFNIDLMKYSEHLLAEQYLTMLYSNNLLPLTTKPTRLTQHTSTLTDHIYTNSNLRVDASIALNDISDHLPVFCILDRQISTFRRASYFRDYRNIDAVDWISVCNESNDIHEEATNCISKPH